MLPEAANSCGAALGAQNFHATDARGAKVAPVHRAMQWAAQCRSPRGRAHCTPFGKMGAGLRGVGEFPSRAPKALVYEVETQYL